jgi:hypothetical protein
MVAQLSAVAVGDIRGPFATDHLRAYALSIIATPNARNTMMTAGYKTSDASNRRKRGCWPCFGMPMITRSTPTMKSTRPIAASPSISSIGGLLSAAVASSWTKQEIAQPAVSVTCHLDGSRPHLGRVLLRSERTQPCDDREGLAKLPHIEGLSLGPLMASGQGTHAASYGDDRKPFGVEKWAVTAIANPPRAADLRARTCGEQKNKLITKMNVR